MKIVTHVVVSVISIVVVLTQSHPLDTLMEDDFVATNEYQVVGDNQVLPPGLDIRVNLQTGVKEARLMPPSTTKHDDSHKRLMANVHKPVLERRRPKTIVERIRECVQVLIDRKTHDESTVKSAMETLEDYLHDVEYAHDFVKIGGVRVLVSVLTNPLARNKDEGIAYQSMAAWVLGTVSQNLRDVQEVILKADGIDALVTLLSQCVKSGPGAGVDALVSKLLYALSSCIRSNEQAQEHFAQIHGVDALMGLAKFVGGGGWRSNVNLKWIRFIGDILDDRAYNGGEDHGSSKVLTNALATFELCKSVLSVAATDSNFTPSFVDEWVNTLTVLARDLPECGAHVARHQSVLVGVRARLLDTHDGDGSNDYATAVGAKITKLLT